MGAPVFRVCQKTCLPCKYGLRCVYAARYLGAVPKEAGLLANIMSSFSRRFRLSPFLPHKTQEDPPWFYTWN